LLILLRKHRIKPHWLRWRILDCINQRCPRHNSSSDSPFLAINHPILPIKVRTKSIFVRTKLIIVRTKLAIVRTKITIVRTKITIVRTIVIRLRDKTAGLIRQARKTVKRLFE
jgi:hypothetical protein